MSNVITLASIKATVKEKYAPTIINLGGGKKVELAQPIRLGESDREALFEQIDSLQGVEERNPDEMFDAIRSILAILAGDGAEALFTAVGDDNLVLMELFSAWSEANQPGEAESSPA